MRQTRATPGKARVSRFTPNEASRPLRASLAQKRQKIAPVLQAVFHHEIQTSEEGDFPLPWSPVEKNSRKLILILLSYELGSIFFCCAKVSLFRNGHVHRRSFSLHTGLYAHAYSFAVRESTFFHMCRVLVMTLG